MKRYCEAGIDESLGCVVAKFVVADGRPRIPLGQWPSVGIQVPSRSSQIAIQPFNDGLVEEPGSHLAFAILCPIIARDEWYELPITWHSTGAVDTAWWHEVWVERFRRPMPRFGCQPFCIMGAGNVQHPPEGVAF